MTLLFATLRHIQLFLFAFTLAGGSMLLVGISSGEMERSETYVSLSASFAGAINQAFPGFLDRYVASGNSDVTIVDARRVSGQAAQPQVRTVQPRMRATHDARASLHALRMRQNPYTQPQQ